MSQVEVVENVIDITLEKDVPNIPNVRKLRQTQSSSFSEVYHKILQGEHRLLHSFRNLVDFDRPSKAEFMKLAMNGQRTRMQTLLSPENLNSVLQELPTCKPDLTLPDIGKLKMTWVGHSTMVFNVSASSSDGATKKNVAILTDPIFSLRAGGSQYVGVKRYKDVPFTIDDIPADIFIVLISHDHYDHLDLPTIQSIEKLSKKEVSVLYGATWIEILVDRHVWNSSWVECWC